MFNLCFDEAHEANLFLNVLNGTLTTPIHTKNKIVIKFIPPIVHISTKLRVTHSWWRKTWQKVQNFLTFLTSNDEKG